MQHRTLRPWHREDLNETPGSNTPRKSPARISPQLTGMYNRFCSAELNLLRKMYNRFDSAPGTSAGRSFTTGR